jgi:hypothetical protein
MDNLLSAAGSATTSVKANEEKTAALNTKVARQRRKSKDLGEPRARCRRATAGHARLPMTLLAP